jgi:hypothetical protein
MIVAADLWLWTVSSRRKVLKLHIGHIFLERMRSSYRNSGKSIAEIASLSSPQLSM